jgi:DNA protecting protein DprA
VHISAMAQGGRSTRGRYLPPTLITRAELKGLIRASGRATLGDNQFDMLRHAGTNDVFVYCAGDISLLKQTTVSIVGTRDVSDCGWKRAARLGRELAAEGVVVMSGLARGVDTAALKSAIQAGGRVAAVIGTSLAKAYPAENAGLQEEIYSGHLLVSPFREGETVYKSNFPKRNRVMALLSDATVIVEASDTSGTLHQAAECLRQDRWLFILKSVVDDGRLTWPKKFLGKPKVVILEKTEDIHEAVRS